MDTIPLTPASETFENLVGISSQYVYEIVDHGETIFIGIVNEGQNIVDVLSHHFSPNDDTLLGIHLSIAGNQGWRSIQVRAIGSLDPVRTRDLLLEEFQSKNRGELPLCN